MNQRTLVWRRDDVVGTEIAFVAGRHGLSARGSAIAAGPTPYRLEYVLETEQDFTTRRFVVSARGLAWERRITLTRGEAGRWTCEASSRGGEHELSPAGGDVDSLAGALDVDLGFSPLTNTPPVLRSDLLLTEGPIEVDAAWISVPDLSVQRLEQRYSLIRRDPSGATVRYETRAGTFSADLQLDLEGFVLRYPGLATRAPT